MGGGLGGWFATQIWECPFSAVPKPIFQLKATFVAFLKIHTTDALLHRYKLKDSSFFVTSSKKSAKFPEFCKISPNP